MGKPTKISTTVVVMLMKINTLMSFGINFFLCCFPYNILGTEKPCSGS